ncbi:MAG: phosphopantetheine-binding protein [Anaerotignum sp.]|nr:phosphopantetheine-binding protein [Anaerotignum sp.]
MIEKLRKDVIDSLNDMGIITNDLNENEDIDLTEYLQDSIQFIQFIVTLEDKLEVDIPDEVLNISAIKSLEGFVNLLDGIVNLDY